MIDRYTNVAYFVQTSASQGEWQARSMKVNVRRQ